jgi:hypothetical protein
MGLDANLPGVAPAIGTPPPEDVAQSALEALKAVVCTSLTPHSSTPRCRARIRMPATKDGLPRCNARVAAQGKRRVSNPEVQAQNVHMKKWKITSEAHSPDADTLQAYNDMYNSPVGPSKRKAIRALFMASCPEPVVGPLDMAP